MGVRGGTVVLRVPSDRFDAALADLRALGEVEHESAETRDVTKAYADIETRLGVQRDTERRLRELMRTRAGELSEVLEVERELARIVEGIERLEGERRYHDHRIAIPTITVRLHEGGAAEEPGLTAALAAAFRRGVESLEVSLAAFVMFATFLGPWLVVTAVAWWTVGAIRSRRQRRGERAVA